MARTPYDSRWRAVRPLVLTRDNFECQLNGEGCEKHATEVDHIVPLQAGGARLDLENLRAICKHCNVARSNALRARLAKVALEGREPPPPSRRW